MNLALLLSQTDARIFLSRYRKSSNTKIIASGIGTFDYLRQRKIKFDRLSDYLDLNQAQAIWKKTTSVSKRFVDQPKLTAVLNSLLDLRLPLSQTLNRFLADILNSQQIAERLLEKNHPTKIYLSDWLLEPLLQKAHHEKFTLFRQVMIKVCGEEKIPVRLLRRQSRPYTFELLILIWRSLLETVINLVKSILGWKKSPSGSRSTKAKPKTVLISASNHMLLNTKGLVDQLQKIGAVIAVGKLKPSEENKLRRRKVNFINPNSTTAALSIKNLLLSQTASLKIFCRYLTLPRSVKRHLLTKSLNFSFFSLLEPYLAYCCSNFAHELIKNYLFIEQSYRQSRFDFVLSSDNLDPFNTALLSFAAQNNLPYALLIHDAKSNNFHRDFFFKPNDTLFLWGDYQQRLISNQFPRLKCLVTGHPDFDSYVKIFKKPPPLASLAKKKVIKLLFLTSFNPLIQHPNDEILFDVLKELNRIKNFPIQVTLKPHPSENHLLLVRLLKKYLDYPLKLSHAPTDKLIAQHDLVISQSTSAGVRAILHHRPTIYLDIRDYRDYQSYAKARAALGVYSLNQLIPAIQKLVVRPNLLTTNQNRFILDFCYRIDGGAAKRITNEINRIIKT